MVALIRGGKLVKQLKKGEDGIVIVNQTPFYGKSGGQTGDTGVVGRAEGHPFRRDRNARRTRENFGAFGCGAEGDPEQVGDAVELHADKARRRATRANHSATHLLHEALRETLGTHVTQKGSLVDPEGLRLRLLAPETAVERRTGPG